MNNMSLFGEVRTCTCGNKEYVDKKEETCICSKCGNILYPDKVKVKK